MRTPHMLNRSIRKGAFGDVCALHRAWRHNARAEQRLGKGFDAQHARAQRDDFGILCKDRHKLRRKQKQQDAAAAHQQRARQR